MADAITGFYERVTGRRPPRERRAYYDGADELYNRGTSLLALGADDKALACYERALATDPQHFLAAYGRTVLGWRAGRLTDVEAVRQVEDARQFVALRSRGFAASQAPRAQALEALAGLHAERGAAGAADGLVAEARATRRKLTPSLAALGQSLVGGIEPGKMFRTHERATGYALAEDGRRVVALGVDSAGTATLVRWDLGVQRATARSPLPGVGELRGVALARDAGRALALGSGGAFLWEEVADAARALPGTAGAVAGALSPDGARLAIAFADRVVHETLGGARRELAYAGARALFLSSRPDEVLALGEAELAWLDASGRPRLVVGGVRAAAWQDDGLVCFVARRDTAGRSLLEARSPAVAAPKWSHVLPEPQAALAVSPDGGALVTVAEDGTFRRWDARVGRCRTTAPMGFALPPRAIFVGRAGLAPALVDAEGKLHGYTLPRELPRAPFPILRPTRSEELLGRQERLEAALAAARARGATDVPAAAPLLERLLQTPWIARLPEVRALWEQLAARSAKGELVAAWPSLEIAAASAPVVAVELAADGAHVVSACARGEGVSVWSAQTGERLRRLHAGVPVTGLALAELRDVLAVATPGEVALWDYRLGRALRSFPELAGVRSVALSASGERLAVARGPDVEVWDVATGARLGRIAQAAGPAAGAEVRRVALDAAGTSVLVAASSGLFRHPLGGPAAAAPFPASVETLDVALSACDGWALSGARDGTLRLWTVDGVGVYRAASEHALTGVALSHDRRLAVTVDARGVAAVWSFPDAARLAVLSGHAGPATDVAMTPSGRHAATAGQDGRVRVWTLEWSLDPFPRSDHDARAERDRGRRGAPARVGGAQPPRPGLGRAPARRRARRPRVIAPAAGAGRSLPSSTALH
ncbi:MAG: tetratricopeptide repeat protein [Myxococcales bacterium]|nr:tetratricopeptide repeat protein [Myxococcales bacterium]